MALFPGRAGDKSAEHVASFNEQCDPQAKPAVLQYFGKTTVNNKGMPERRGAKTFRHRKDHDSERSVSDDKIIVLVTI